ncbi:HTH domain-containing protein [Klebsiella sp. Ap-873]|nr:HTH domain-containing protein [Klebsiella sp. Ap-873]
MTPPEKSTQLANRIAGIFCEMLSCERVSRHQLASKFGVSERTIYRDLRRLSNYVYHVGEDQYALSLEVTQQLENYLQRVKQEK